MDVPMPDRYAKQMHELGGFESGCLSRLVAFALGGLLFAPIFPAAEAIDRLPRQFIRPIAIGFVILVIGLFFLIWHNGVNYLAARRARKMIYAITNLRVIESHPWRTRSYRPEDLRFLRIRAGTDDVGDILFTVRTLLTEDDRTDVDHGLIGVRCPERVGNLLRATFPQVQLVSQ